MMRLNQVVTKLILGLAGLALTLPVVGATIPRPAPEYTYQTGPNTTGNFSQYKGKLLVVEFLLTGCSHCQKISRELQALQTEFGPKGLQVVGVAIDDQYGNRVGPFKQEQGVTFPVGFIRNKDSAYGFLEYSVMKAMLMPQLVIIDRSGVIQRQISGEEPILGENSAVQLRAIIEKMLGPAAASKTAPKTTSAKPATATSPKKASL